MGLDETVSKLAVTERNALCLTKQGGSVPYLTSTSIAAQLGLSHTLVKATIKRAGISYYPNRSGEYLCGEDAVADVAKALMATRKERKARSASKKAYEKAKEQQETKGKKGAQAKGSTSTSA